MNTAVVAPRIGNWLSIPVNWPPSTGATSVMAAVTDPAITIRAATSHLGGATTRRTGPGSFGQHRTTTPIPPKATSAPTTGGSTISRNTTPSSR